MTDPTTDPARGVPDCWLPAAQQCPGCTYYASQVRELAYLHARGVTYATVCQGPLDESLRYRAFLGWETPWYATGGDGAASAARGLDGAHAPLCYLRIGDRVFEARHDRPRPRRAMGGLAPPAHPDAGVDAATSRSLPSARPGPSRECTSSP